VAEVIWQRAASPPQHSHLFSHPDLHCTRPQRALAGRWTMHSPRAGTRLPRECHLLPVGHLDFCTPSNPNTRLLGPTRVCRRSTQPFLQSTAHQSSQHTDTDHIQRAASIHCMRSMRPNFCTQWPQVISRQCARDADRQASTKPSVTFPDTAPYRRLGHWFTAARIDRKQRTKLRRNAAVYGRSN